MIKVECYPSFLEKNLLQYVKPDTFHFQTNDDFIEWLDGEGATYQEIGVSEH